MERRRITATNMCAVGYDPAGRVLEIEFTNGTVLRYNGVPAEVHRRLVSAASPATYWRDNIEDEYPAQRSR
jgi:YD repeat-containing protein